MASEKYNFNFAQPPADGQAIRLEVIERTGQAEVPVREKKAFSMTVLITSILGYINTRTVPTPIQENPGVIVYSIDPEHPFIKYYENPNDSLATVLKAKMEVNPDLEAFRINTQQGFYQKDLENHVRSYAHCFTSLDEVKDIIKRLQNFDVRYEQQVKQADDRQGQTEQAVKSALKFASGELPKVISLRLPLYLGTPAQEVTLEIEVDRGKNNMPVFSFYSLDLELRKREVIEVNVSNQVAELRASFPILEADGDV